MSRTPGSSFCLEVLLPGTVGVNEHFRLVCTSSGCVVVNLNTVPNTVHLVARCDPDCRSNLLSTGGVCKVLCKILNIISSMVYVTGFPFGFGPWHWFVFSFQCPLDIPDIPAMSWFSVWFRHACFCFVFCIPHQSILMSFNYPIVSSLYLRMVWSFCQSVWAWPWRCEDLNSTQLSLMFDLAIPTSLDWSSTHPR